MRRAVATLLLCVIAFALGLVLMRAWSQPAEPKLPDPPAVVTQMREVAKLEALDLTLYKKLSFAPDPQPADNLWDQVSGWAKYNLRPSHGKAILFAHVHVGLNLARLDAEHLRIEHDRVLLVLPPLESQVELRPAETEVIDSNLSSAETAQLFELARAAFEREVQADPRLHEKALSSAQRALTGLLLGLGFREVRFVESLPRAAAVN